MNRAIDLARRGAGRVSPNPMVGALLVKDGRIVGEGFHRYDLLKHGETYAIEMAGSLARGATLYCNLEPCCHHGRTPPCTDALIEAEISRAVIATKDPFSKVNGRGIEQLRAAEIDVEIGLCEDEAIRLNEAYFKFVTRDSPFVHGVIEYAGDKPWTAAEWKPSREFVEMAREYDAIVLGSRAELNRLLIEEWLSEKRHRPLVVAGTEVDLKREPDVFKDRTEEVLVTLSLSAEQFDQRELKLAPRPQRLRDAGAPKQAASEGTEPDLASVLPVLAQMSVTSVLLLPGIFDSSAPKNFELLDKVTLAVPGAGETGVTATRLVFANLEFDLEDVSLVETDGYTEFTGYPSFRGVA